MKKGLDLVVELVLEHLPCKIHAFLVAHILVHLDEHLQLLQPWPQDSRLRFQLLPRSSDVGGLVFEVLLALHRAVHENPLEVVPCPLNGVLDLVGEILQGAEGNGLLRRVLAFAVALRLERDN